MRLKRGDFALLRHTIAASARRIGYRYHAIVMNCSLTAGRPGLVSRSCGRTVYECRRGALRRLSGK